MRMLLSTRCGFWWEENRGAEEKILQDSGYFINRHRRSVRCSWFLAARLRADSAGFPKTAGVGDGILIHPEKSFFAVGDCSDRNPQAVRQTMERFIVLLEGFPALEAGRTVFI